MEGEMTSNIKDYHGEGGFNGFGQ